MRSARTNVSLAKRTDRAPMHPIVGFDASISGNQLCIVGNKSSFPEMRECPHVQASNCRVSMLPFPEISVALLEIRSSFPEMRECNLVKGGLLTLPLFIFLCHFRKCELEFPEKRVQLLEMHMPISRNAHVHVSCPLSENPYFQC